VIFDVWNYTLPPPVCLSVCLCVCLSFSLSTSISVCISLCLSASQSVSHSFCVSVSVSVFLFVSKFLFLTYFIFAKRNFLHFRQLCVKITNKNDFLSPFSLKYHKKIFLPALTEFCIRNTRNSAEFKSQSLQMYELEYFKFVQGRMACTRTDRHYKYTLKMDCPAKSKVGPK
jgi:hypothetical protein